MLWILFYLSIPLFLLFGGLVGSQGEELDSYCSAAQVWAPLCVCL